MHDEYLDTPIWGAKAIGEVICRTARQTNHLAATKQIPVEKIGNRLVSTRRRLLARINGETAVVEREAE